MYKHAVQCTCGRYCSLLCLSAPNEKLFAAQYCNFCNEFSPNEKEVVPKILSGEIEFPLSKENLKKYRKI